MRKVFILSTVAAVALGLASADLLAQRPGGDGGNGRGRAGVQTERPGARGPAGFMGRFRGGSLGAGPVAGMRLRGLDLSDEQRTKVQTIVADSRESASPVAEELRTARRSLQQAIFAERPDAGAVQALTTRVIELERQLADIRIDTSTAIAEVLTPQQRETLRDGVGPGRGAAARGGPGRGPGRGPARGPAGFRS